MKRTIAILTVMVMCLSMAAMPAAAEPDAPAAEYKPIYAIDFEGPNGDGTGVNETPFSDTVQPTISTWLPSTYDAGKVGVDNGVSNYTYQATKDPANKGHGKVLQVQAPAVVAGGIAVTNDGIHFTSTINKEFCDKTDLAIDVAVKKEDGTQETDETKIGYVDFSFDYYAESAIDTEVHGGYWAWDYDNNRHDSTTALNKPFFKVFSDGTFLMFGTKKADKGADEYTPYGTSEEFQEKWPGKWHNIRIILTGNNKYQTIIDGVPLSNDLVAISNTAWTKGNSGGINSLIIGMAQSRFMNLNSQNSGERTYYIDNIRYGIGKLSDRTIDLTTGEEDKFDADVGMIYTSPDRDVADFTQDLQVTSYWGESVNKEDNVQVVKADGEELTAGTMKDAAAVLITTASGRQYRIDIVAMLKHDLLDENASIDNDRIKIATDTFEKWVPDGYYYTRGYDAKPTAGIGGKTQEDNSVKISLRKNVTENSDHPGQTSNQSAYLNLNLQDSTTLRRLAHAPMTTEFSLYVPSMNKDKANQGIFQLSLEDSSGGQRNIIRVENGQYMLGEANDNKNGSFKCDAWNRIAVCTYPDSKSYKVYLNGVLLGENSLAANPVYTRRLRFFFTSAIEGEYYALDDVSVTYGIYEPGYNLTVTSEDSGSVKAEAASRNGANANLMNAMLLVGEFDGEVLKNVHLVKGTPSTDAPLSYTLEGVTEPSKVKAFLWDAENMTPLCGAGTAN